MPRTEKQKVAIMRNFGLMQIECFKSQLSYLLNTHYDSFSPPMLSNEEKNQFQSIINICNKLEEPWHDNTLMFTGGDAV